MIDLRKLFKSSVRDAIMNALAFLPDKMYLQMFYFSTTGHFINFKNPKGLSEKQQWLKIYDQHPEYSRLVDKLAVRDHIDSVLGEGHMFPLLGKWERFEDIDFDSLPDQFVIKCNHDSGSTRVINSKDELTSEKLEEMKKFYNKRLSRDFFYAGREYPYKGIKPYIIAEKLMVDEEHPGKSIEDYKFFCFNGEPRVMFVVTDRNTDCRVDFFDMDFQHLDIVNNHPNSDKPIAKPAKFDEMKEIAAILSKGMPFVRIDLYELNGIIYFGEYTFYNCGGFRLCEPPEWEQRMGDWIELPKTD